MIVMFGGTFDPIHQGHLALIEQAMTVVKPDQLLLVPCFQPVHKQHSDTGSQHRLAMLDLALQTLPDDMQQRVKVDLREINAQKPRYTVDTLTSMRQEIGAEESLVFLMGADSLQALDTWHQWHQLGELAHLLVYQRPGYDLNDAALPSTLELWCKPRKAPPEKLFHQPAGLVSFLPGNLHNVSSSEFRQGKIPFSSLPVAISNYIVKHGLYDNG